MSLVEPDEARPQWLRLRYLPLALVLILFILADVAMATVKRGRAVVGKCRPSQEANFPLLRCS